MKTDRIKELTDELDAWGVTIEFDMPGEGFTMTGFHGPIELASLSLELQALVTELESLTT